MKNQMLLLVPLFLASTLHAAGPVINVRDLGAKGDGETLDTAALQRAFDQVRRTGGTIVFPPGTYLSAPLNLRGNDVTVRLDEGATLLATTNHAAFLKSGAGNWLEATSNSDFVPFLSIKDSTNLTLTGQGTIDGNGPVWWEEAEKARQRQSGFTLPRPNLIVPQRIQNLRVTGLTIQRSPKFHLVPTECEEVWIEGVRILAPERAPNTDAIDPSLSRNVTITNCFIDVGDDNIAIKSGRKVPGREFACENILITHCTFRHGHGMSIGSETVGGVRNVVVRHCTFENTVNGIRIKSDRKRGGIVDGLVCEEITMKNVRGALTLTSYYPRIPATDEAQPVTDTTPKYRNIVIRNLTATSTRNAGFIVGLPESVIENVRLENVTITAEQAGLEIRHARGVELKNVTITPRQGPPVIERDAEVKRP
ncbi:MAG: glycoside hydrolase family 28 protein [Limisphaerales bacterium]